MDYEIQEFGRRVGLANLAFSSEGLARLDIQDVGNFYLERSGDGRELLVYLTARIPDYDAGRARRLLALCDYRNGFSLPVAAGIHAGQAILLIRLQEKSVTAAALENSLRFLTELMSSTAQS